MGKKVKKASSSRPQRRATQKGPRPLRSRPLLERQLELYEEIKRHNEELQRATEHKSQFLARMSHEIRIPLSIVMGFLDILGLETLGTLNKEQKTAVDKMLVQSQKLQKMIGDVLSLSQIEAGIIPLEISTFSMERIIESLRAVADTLQRKTDLKVRWDIDQDLPPLTTDASKLEEILQNMMVNAFKYTSKGEVRIRIKNRLDSKSVEFVVEDTGRGIAAENISKIFDGFQQIDATTSNQGVGLGLAIVKKYLELLKGDIQVQSEPGKGSTFTLILPHTLKAKKSHSARRVESPRRKDPASR
jgi:signal transduction histidine kinase